MKYRTCRCRVVSTNIVDKNYNILAINEASNIYVDTSIDSRLERVHLRVSIVCTGQYNVFYALTALKLLV